MNASRRHQRLLWLIAGWLFIAPFLGFQHLYGAHSYVADDVCETCVLSSSGGQALAPQLALPPATVAVNHRLVALPSPAYKITTRRAKARAPPRL